jgi:gliding motility-associated-like protein
LEEYELFIFDRWGGLVFHSQQALDSWDGRLREQDQPNGVYAFRVRYRFKSNNDQSVHQSHGMVQLLR